MIDALFVVMVVMAWELGGQYDKLFRRLGIPVAILCLGIWHSLHGEVWWNKLPLLLICPELFLGYGQGSWVAKHFNTEWVIRAVYGFLLWVPIAIVALLHGHVYFGLFSAVLIGGAFQIHAGALFMYRDKAFLIEDLFRSLAVGVSIVGAIR
jgi:hypothetical protein